MILYKYFEQFDDSCEPAEDSVSFEWTANGIGFGEFYFYRKDGDLYCDNETMSKEFIKRMLCQMVDDCILTDPREDPKEDG